MENYGTSVPFMVNFITGDKSGTVGWGNNQGLHRMDGHGLKDFGLADGLSGSVVKWIDLGPGGNLLVVTGERGLGYGRRGLHSFQDGKITRIELAEFGIEDDVICALEDHEGSVWAGTRTDGLIRLQTRRIASFTEQDGLIDGTSLSICEATDGTIYVGTKRGLSGIRLGKVTNHLMNSHVDAVPTLAVFPDRDGGVWTGRVGEFLHNFGPVKWNRKPIDGTKFRDSLDVNSVYIDGNDILWLGRKGGVSQCKIDEARSDV